MSEGDLGCKLARVKCKTCFFFFLVIAINFNGSVPFICFCSVTQTCPTLCNPMDCSTPGFPVLHNLPEFAQTHVEPVMPSNHLILCGPLLLLPSIFPSIRVFSNESSELISFRINWSDFPVVQGALKSLLQHYNLKASVLRCLAFFMVQLSTSVHDYWKTHNF